MADFVQNNWCFAPYLGALLLLTVMSVLEGRVANRRRKSILPAGEKGWPIDADPLSLFRQLPENRAAVTILKDAQFRTTGPAANS